MRSRAELTASSSLMLLILWANQRERFPASRQHSSLLPESSRLEHRGGPGSTIDLARSDVAILPAWDDSYRSSSLPSIVLSIDTPWWLSNPDRI